MSFNESAFNKENLDLYLRELSKTFRKLNGKTFPAEIILIGGASVLINYGFRNMTYDMDAIIISSSAMKQAINQVGDKFGLPNGWLNTDFVKTKSYSPKLIEHSVYYKTFSGVLTVRTVTAEYMIAMKLMAGRKYKNDLSDVIGILKHHKDNGAPITLDQIKKAVKDLYGEWSSLPQTSISFIEQAIAKGNYGEAFDEIRNSETVNKTVLQSFETDYPGALKESNLDEILRRAAQKMSKEDESKDEDPSESPTQTM